MTNRSVFIFSCLLLISCIGFGQERIKVNIPTAIEETEYIWRTIQDTKFFEENNYQVALPKGMLIAALKEKARENRLSEADYEALKSFVQNSVYDASQYAAGYAKIEAQLPLLHQFLEKIGGMQRNWDFKEFA
ncbi:MAG: hypothetical protein AAGA62_00715, partial [Bacteroidota bacterium]